MRGSYFPHQRGDKYPKGLIVDFRRTKVRHDAAVVVTRALRVWLVVVSRAGVALCRRWV